MKRALFYCLFATLLVGTKTELQAQDIHFSQYYMAPLYQNPALAGALHDLQANVNFKEQWKSFGNAYRTTAASFDLTLQKKKSNKGFFAAGVNFFSDKAGDSNLKTSLANLTIAYHIELGDYQRLGIGIQGGIFQRGISYTSTLR